MILIENGWGIKRVGVRQRKLLSRMAINGGEWDTRWWLNCADRQAMNGLIKKGFVEQYVLPTKVLNFRIAEEFQSRMKALAR